MPKITARDEILAAIRKCAEQLGRPPKVAELQTAVHLDMSTVRRYFGSYTGAIRHAGVKLKNRLRVPTETLLKDWAQVACKLGRIPTILEYESQGNYSMSSFFRQFKRWTNVPYALERHVERCCGAAAWQEVMGIIRASYEEKSTEPQKAATIGGKTIFHARELNLPDLPIYGDPLGLPSMMHAPINEMGVVYLFGAVAEELGFLVTRIQNGYPDGEALRRVDDERWQRVRIEFEFESRNFRTHGHDPKKCDLIVCWTHNWAECPLPVLELRAIVKKLCRSYGALHRSLNLPSAHALG
ncbi:MAG TPA: hypothetical protein VIB39_03650 [Candidatus Angelobacter sp.]|jgi:AraC-like DNA-binding protein